MKVKKYKTFTLKMLNEKMDLFPEALGNWTIGIKLIFIKWQIPEVFRTLGHCVGGITIQFNF